MNISSVEGVSAFQAANTRQQIDMALLKKTLDVSKAQSQAAIELLDSAAQISKPQQSQGKHRLDIKI